MSDYLDSNGLQRVWGKFKENISSYKTIENTSIASFSDGSNLPLKSLTADITALQDLHGYDYPWVGGSGLNLFHMNSSISQTSAGVVYTSDDNYMILNNTKSGGSTANFNNTAITLPSGTYYAKAFAISGTASKVNQSFNLRDNGASVVAFDLSTVGTFTLSEEKTLYLSTTIWEDGITYNNYKIGIVVSKTSSIDKFYPYSNICPISGWDEVNVTRCGKNLFDYTHFQFVDMGYINGYGVWEGSRTIKNYPTDNIGNEWNSLLIDVSALRSQNVSFSGFVGSTAIGIIDENFKVLYTMGTSVPTSGSVDLSQYPTAKYFVIGFYLIGYDFDNAQFELGTTATTYEPYNGQTITIDLDGTRYGGTLDVVSGVLTVDRAYVDMGSPTWRYTNNRFYYNPTNAKVYTQIEVANMLCSQYPISQYLSQADNSISSYAGYIYVRADSYSGDTTAFKTAMNGVQLVYELDTPTTYQLSKQQIRSLVETNIFADTGAIKKVEYQPDNIVGELREDIYAIKIPIVIANVVSKSGNTVTLDKSLYQIIELAEAGYTVRIIDKVSSQYERFFYDLNYIYNSDQWKTVEFQNIMTFSSLSVRVKTLIAEDEGDGDTYQFDIISETNVVAPTPTSSDVNKSLKVNSDLDPYWSN